MIETHTTAPLAHKPGTRPTVLLAEDSLVQRTAIAAILDKNGFHVEEASDGTEALRHLKLVDRQPDVVLADVGMPRLNGINLCRQIRSDPATRHIPVIMLTVLDNDRNHVTAMEAGADEFLVKPVSEHELVARLQLLLKAAKTRTVDRNDWHRQLFELQPDAVLVTDLQDHIVEANRIVTRLLGYSREELLKLQSQVLIRHSNAWIETERNKLKEAGTWEGRLPLRHLNGSTVELEARACDAFLDRQSVTIWSLRPAVLSAAGKTAR